MRILILSSSQEPARDGVGDYVRALAGACLHRGHSCAVVALHDVYVQEMMESTEATPRGGISLLRLPATMPWSERIKRARTFVTGFQPDWISLQFVAYGFNGRGLMFRLNRGLQELTSGYRLHLMFHELWIGLASAASLRHRLMGAMQRLGIKRMLARLKPETVTTTNPLYQSILKQNGIQAGLLPLFGNIPILPPPPKLSLPVQLADALILPDNEGARTWWIGIFFGALHPEWRSKSLLPLLLRAAQSAKRRICLVHVGRIGTSGKAVWNDLRRDYPSSVSLVNLDEQSTDVISTLLQISDFGITTMPWQLLGKSGTVAAMLEHGLPVLVSRDDVQLPDPPEETIPSDPLLHRCDDTLETKLERGLPKRPARIRLDEIADQFLSHLQ